MSFFTLFVCCLIGLLSACGQQSVAATNQSSSANSTQSVTHTNQPVAQTGQNSSPQSNTQPVVQTVPMPPTQTSCPTDGTARAAVMKPLALGKKQNLVYIYNEIPLNTSMAYGHLKRYDLNTQQKTDIVTSGISIESAQVSADGQWILFLSTPDPRGDALHSAMLQLVRMDGQGLQTLYCFPAVSAGSQMGMNVPVAQWSVDQKSILLSYDVNTSTSVVSLLNVDAGTLVPELKYTDNQLYHYSVDFWLDNTHAYVEKSGRSAPAPPIELDLLDITTNHNLNGGDLKKVLTHSVRMSYLSTDSSYDGSHLFVSYCLLASNPFDTTISAGTATGSVLNTIYHQAQTVCVHDLRAISNTDLLMTVQKYNTSTQTTDRNQVWTMKPDASHQKILFDLPNDGSNFSLNQTSQYPWSNLSRDGQSYALQSANNNTKQSAILIASVVGGNPTSIADTVRGSVSLAGWTIM